MLYFPAPCFPWQAVYSEVEAVASNPRPNTLGATYIHLFCTLSNQQSHSNSPNWVKIFLAWKICLICLLSYLSMNQSVIYLYVSSAKRHLSQTPFLSRFKILKTIARNPQSPTPSSRQGRYLDLYEWGGGIWVKTC